MNLSVQRSTIYNSQDMETTQMSTDPLTDEWIKNICVYIQFNTICGNMNGPRDYHRQQSKSEKDKILLFTATWIDLKIIIQGEVSRNRKTNI